MSRIDDVTTARDGVEARLRRIQERIADAAGRAGRSPSDVTLIAVSKTFPLQALVEAWEAGVRHFGENRVQEAETKIELWDPARPVTWHLIGHLQTNKAKSAARRFDWIHSVDSERIALALDRQLASTSAGPGRRPILLEVNYAGEESKDGLAPDDVAAVLGQVDQLAHLEVRGLMTVAPLTDNAEAVRPVFRGLRKLRDRLRERFPALRLDELSMGMTGDFEVAIEEGATIVRVGRAIFGERA